MKHIIMQDFILYTCAYLDVVSQTITSVEKLHKTNYDFDWWFVTADALIARARSVAAYRFLTRSDAPYMIFLDADIVFEPEDVTKILNELKGGKDVVAGLYAMQGGNKIAICDWEDKQVDLTGDVIDVRYVSTGFMGISRSILKKIAKNMPLLQKGDWSECYPFFETKVHDGFFLSEDWDFCEKVRKAGSRVYAHTGVWCEHIKRATMKIG
jgi:choline kinase